MGLPHRPDEHRSERPVLLAVDQELGEGATLWVAPELADPVCPLEVGEHDDMEELGTRSGTEGLQAFAKPELTLVGSHVTAGYAVVPASRGHARSTGPSQPEGALSPTAEKVGAGAAAKSPGAVPLGHQEAARIDSTLCPLRLPRTQSG